MMTNYGSHHIVTVCSTMMNNASKYSALWVMQSTTGLRPMDCINKSGLIKGSEVFWLNLPSQIVIRLIWSYKTLITLVLIQQ